MACLFRSRLHPGNVYSVQFEYRADAELGIGLWDIDERGQQVQDFTRYNDRAPAHNEWQPFESTIFVPTILGKSAALLFPSDGGGRSCGE